MREQTKSTSEMHGGVINELELTGRTQSLEFLTGAMIGPKLPPFLGE